MRLYLVLCFVVSSLVFIPRQSSEILFWSLVVITLPWGLWAAPLTYYVSFAFPEFVDSILGRVILQTLWVVGVLTQVWLFTLAARLRSR